MPIRERRTEDTMRLSRALAAFRVLNSLERQYYSARQKLDLIVQGMTKYEIQEYMSRTGGLITDPDIQIKRRRMKHHNVE